MRSHCSTCERPLLWAWSEHGKRIPIDPEPTTDGNIVLRRIATGADSVAHVLGRDEETDEERYTSHFATCPQADTHRRRRERAATR